MAASPDEADLVRDRPLAERLLRPHHAVEPVEVEDHLVLDRRHVV